MQSYTKTTALEKHEVSGQWKQRLGIKQVGGKKKSVFKIKKKKTHVSVSWFFWNLADGLSAPENEGPTGTTWNCLETKLSSVWVLRSATCFHLQVLSRQPVRTSGIWVKLVVMQLQLNSWNTVILTQMGFSRSYFLYALHANLRASDLLRVACSLSTPIFRSGRQDRNTATLHWIIKSSTSACLSYSPWWKSFFSSSSHRLSSGVSQVFMMLPGRRRAACIQWSKILLLS